MKAILLLTALFATDLAYANIALKQGQSVEIGNNIVSCDDHNRPSTRCFCADRGCSTGYTSRGNVILNIVTTDSNGSSSTQCVDYGSESSCFQAMGACN